MEASADSGLNGMTLEGTFRGAQVHLHGAEVTEALSRIPEIRVEFLTTEGRFDPRAMLGTRLRLTMTTDTGTPRRFQGTVVAIDYIGTAHGFDLYGVDVRPWLWFLTRCSDNRIFQGKSVTEIFEAVCGAHGFGDHRMRLSGTYDPREYCVQYGETDFAFLSRLLEEEGICYYFDHSGDREEMILADGSGSFDPVAGGGKLAFVPRSRNTPREDGHVFEWFTRARVVSGRHTLVDYDMTKPATDLTVGAASPQGRHAHAGYERYEIDGHYNEVSAGDGFARIRMEGEAHRALRYTAVANAPALGAGRRFTLTGEPKLGRDIDFLVIAARHFLRSDARDDPGGALEALAGAPRLAYPEERGRYLCRLEAAPADDPYRPPRETPWPDIAGLHTAVVTGPSGEEIYTDQYGRIKVQFHWDREGAKDENTTCWVRTVVPWSGRGWGMFAVPRIGQEVVIQFERGNPDRPVCTGMLYNDATRHAFEYPANATLSGLRTNSSKGGGGFHELVFEDKKDGEYIRMISEKDYVQTIKNNATISIGQDKKDKGDLTQTIHRHKTETLKTGDHTFTVEDGNQTIKIAKNHDEDIGGTSDTKIKDNTTVTVTEGNFTETISRGNRKREVKQGNDATTVSMGNITMDASAGKITITAAQEITLKVAGSSVKISPSGVDIKGPMIKIDGDGMVAVKAPVSDVKGTAMLVLKGSLTMIN